MAWVILLLVLLAAAFGVLGAVLKLTAILVLTVLLTIAALVAVVSYSFKGAASPVGARRRRRVARRSARGRGVNARSHRGICPPTTTATDGAEDSPAAGQESRQQAPEHQEQTVKASPTATNTRIFAPLGDPTITVLTRNPMGTATIQFLRRLRHPGRR